MSQCIDKHIGDKLFAYELNLLSPDDEALVELHLLQCEYCLAQAKRFAAAAERIREHPEARKLMKRVEADEEAASAVVPEKRSWFSMSRAAVLVAAAVVVLLLRPWELHFHPTEEVVASEPRIAVMYVDNLADPSDSLRLGDIATDLFITGLSQSRNVQVVSSQRLYDILKLIGREGQKRIDRTIATEVAQKSNAKWMLLGSILESTPHLIMTTQLIEVATGQVASAARIQGRDGEDICALADSLISKIGNDLSWTTSAWSGASRPQMCSRTNSLEAYRYYVEGVELTHKYNFPAASKCFRKTIELDSTFAMAYYWIAYHKWVNFQTSDTASIAKAVKYADKLTQREQLYINSMQALVLADYPRGMSLLQDLTARYPDEKEAYRLLGICHARLVQSSEAVQCFLKAIELDSLFGDAYVWVTFEFNSLGDTARARWASDKFISLEPNEPAPYSARGDLCALHGQIDQAIEWYSKAAELDSATYLEGLAYAYLLKKQYSRADSCFQIMAASNDSKSMRSGGRVLLALVPLYQGKFSEAIEILDHGLAADKMEQFWGRSNAAKHVWKGMIYEQRGHLDSALREVEHVKFDYPKFFDPFSKIYSAVNYARLLALNKRFDDAEKVAEDLRKQMGGNETVITDYWWTVGNIELAKGNWESAVVDLENAIRHSDSEFICRASLGTAYLQAGRTNEAIPVLEKALSNYMYQRIIFPVQAVKAYYYLGIAYEKTGRNEDAIKQYEEFLDIWKNADPGIAEVIDARNRLARLKVSS